MFDWFKKDRASSNVVPFPESKEAPKIPYVVPPVPEPEKPATIFYRFGVTDNNRVTLYMSFNEVSMSAEGVDQMIKQLEFYRDMLEPEESEEEQE